MPSFRTRKQSAPLPALPATVCPAKTTPSGRLGVSVTDHCRMVGYVAAALAACHDTGKVSPGYLRRYFQAWLLRVCPEVAGRGRQRCIVHVRVDFQGVLTVTDPAAFVHACRTGIGPAKAFGFGLMLLRPLRQERRSAYDSRQ